MKKTIYESKFIRLRFDEESLVFYEFWNSEEFDEETFKKEMLHKMELMKEYRPKRVLDDVSQCPFTINPELQDWTEKHLNPIVSDLNIDRYALVLPEDLFTQVSLEQTVDEFNVNNVQTVFRYFMTEADGEAWLKN